MSLNKLKLERKVFLVKWKLGISKNPNGKRTEEKQSLLLSNILFACSDFALDSPVCDWRLAYLFRICSECHIYLVLKFEK